MKFHKHFNSFICLFVLTLLVTACNKVDITFGASASTTDPNITYFDNYKVDIATYKPDSFITSNHQVFSIGYHYDSVFGVVKVGSFAQLNLPATNPLLNVTETIVFDSLVLRIKPNGAFYGDSTLPMRINVYRLNQNITTSDNSDIYYNTAAFNYAAAPIGQQTVSLNGKYATPVSVRLSDALGQELLNKFKNSDNDVSTQDNFLNYFKGIYISADSGISRSLAYFNVDTDTALVQLNYHQNGVTPEAKVIKFTYNQTKQFNNISFRYTNSKFASFKNNKAQLISSTSSGNQAFLNTNLGADIKISFPTLLSLKELHPYVKVVKAELIIKPDIKSYSYPYQLPATLNVYSTDDTNIPLAGLYLQGSTSSTTLQTGDLTIDYLYGENTYYSYDITSFINNKIAEGASSTSALLLNNSLGNLDAGLQRLIINDQNNNRPIQLKLYVLGL
jgi:hypothetical protein